VGGWLSFPPTGVSQGEESYVASASKAETGGNLPSPLRVSIAVPSPLHSYQQRQTVSVAIPSSDRVLGESVVRSQSMTQSASLNGLFSSVVSGPLRVAGAASAHASSPPFADLGESAPSTRGAATSGTTMSNPPPLRSAPAPFASLPPLPPSLCPVPTDRFPLHATFLCGVSKDLVNPILALNFAVWKFRKPALAAKDYRDHEWLANRILDVANHCLRACRPKAKDSKNSDITLFINEHYTLIDNFGIGAVFCFTDGSAIPNPGPGGAGAFILAPHCDLSIFAGIPIGHSTNNLGELMGLAICFHELICLFASNPFSKAIVFSDSDYAISMVASTRRPWVNCKAIDIVRKLFRKASVLFALTLKWVKAHAGVPGNETADSISKCFSHRSATSRVNLQFDGDVSYFRSQHIWPYGPPVSTLPPHLFYVPSFPLFPNGSIPIADSKRNDKRKTSTHDSPAGTRRSARLAKINIVEQSVVEPLDFKHSD
jgi:ribonuclease HI